MIFNDFFIRSIIVTILSVFVIALIYIWFIPVFISDCKTEFFIYFLSILSGLLVGFFSFNFLQMDIFYRILISLLYGIFDGVIVFLFSLFIILNVRGS